jgi:hypothetical protein
VTDAAPVREKEWLIVPIRRIEDLSDAVYGAGIQATQMSRGPITGSLAFAECGGILYGTGLLGGRVALSGPLSQNMVTFGLGLRLPAGTWHWYREVATGSVGLLLPGDEHDSLYMPNSLYATATMSLERLEAEAARHELVIDRSTLGGTGAHERLVPSGLVAPIARRMDGLHSTPGAPPELGLAAGHRLLHIAIAHYAREPHRLLGSRLRQPTPVSSPVHAAI